VPTHDNVYVLVVVGDTLVVPDVGSGPDHAPEPAHDDV
jgi:hypothetical protein